MFLELFHWKTLFTWPLFQWSLFKQAAAAFQQLKPRSGFLGRKWLSQDVRSISWSEMTRGARLSGETSLGIRKQLYCLLTSVQFVKTHRQMWNLKGMDCFSQLYPHFQWDVNVTASPPRVVALTCFNLPPKTSSLRNKLYQSRTRRQQRGSCQRPTCPHMVFLDVACIHRIAGKCKWAGVGQAHRTWQRLPALCLLIQCKLFGTPRIRRKMLRESSTAQIKPLPVLELTSVVRQKMQTKQP